ncbi:SRPBCC family protein [Kutzneria sp. NPDC052558]|uniref:SRPBCC family protein n=1 Tax=Kutzneria sp. NPDC052558 TaxID=3364121 RepID=UPI0037C91FC0
MSGHTDNSVVIDAPLDLVWRMTNDVASWPRLFSEYAATEVLERRGDTVLFRITMHPDEQGRSWSWISERTADRTAATVRAHRVETGPFKYMSLFWEYEQTEQGVRMRWVQDFEMKPTAPVTTEDMAARINHNSAGQQKLIKERVEAAAMA